MPDQYQIMMVIRAIYGPAFRFFKINGLQRQLYFLVNTSGMVENNTKDAGHCMRHDAC